MDPDQVLLSRLSSIKNIILVLSGKGGVGKSSVSVQLALSLLDQLPHAQIAILDVDLTGPSLPRMLGLSDGVVLQGRSGWIPVPVVGDTREQRAGKIVGMSIGFLLKDQSESVVWRGPKKNAMIKQFLGEVEWGNLDYLVVDTPPGTSDEHITLLESLRPLLSRSPSSPATTLSSILVTTPQAISILDVSKELSFIRRTELPLIGLIENMSGYVCPHCGDVVGVFGSGGGESFCERETKREESEWEALGEGEEKERGKRLGQKGVRWLGRVPIDRELVALLDDQVDLVLHPEKLGAEASPTRPSLLNRYRKIPSYPVVKVIVQSIVESVELLEKERDEMVFTE